MIGLALTASCILQEAVLYPIHRMGVLRAAAGVQAIVCLFLGNAVFAKKLLTIF